MIGPMGVLREQFTLPPFLTQPNTFACRHFADPKLTTTNGVSQLDVLATCELVNVPGDMPKGYQQPSKDHHVTND
jgi:hypothetical protein